MYSFNRSHIKAVQISPLQTACKPYNQIQINKGFFGTEDLPRKKALLFTATDIASTCMQLSTSAIQSNVIYIPGATYGKLVFLKKI